MTSLSRVREANGLSLAAFERRYCEAVSSSSWAAGLTLTLETSATISESDLLACFRLLRFTSADAYKASSIGWSRCAKLKEMRLSDMKYLLLKQYSEEKNGNSETGSAGNLVGFSSFMLTVEDDIEVTYCYEIHFHPDSQGRGFGPKLMQIIEAIGRAAGVEMAMLTVFTSNAIAERVYRRLGYELHDEEPVPTSKQLRNRKTELRKPSYIILAKALK